MLKYRLRIKVQKYLYHCSLHMDLCQLCAMSGRITSISDNLRASLPRMRITCVCGLPLRGARRPLKLGEQNYQAVCLHNINSGPNLTFPFTFGAAQRVQRTKHGI